MLLDTIMPNSGKRKVSEYMPRTLWLIGLTSVAEAAGASRGG